MNERDFEKLASPGAVGSRFLLVPVVPLRGRSCGRYYRKNSVALASKGPLLARYVKNRGPRCGAAALRSRGDYLTYLSSIFCRLAITITLQGACEEYRALKDQVSAAAPSHCVAGPRVLRHSDLPGFPGSGGSGDGRSQPASPSLPASLEEITDPPLSQDSELPAPAPILQIAKFQCPPPEPTSTGGVVCPTPRCSPVTASGFSR
nr:uncharacterized protein LOC131758040 [Kogia breviceps]